MAVWPNGLGQSLGDSLVTGKPLVTSYTPYFVSSVTGNDSNSGLDQNFPMASLGIALLAAAGAGQTPIVVLMTGHDQVVTANIPTLAGTIIVGAGSANGLPTAKLTTNISNQALLTLNAAGVQLRNIWFKANVVSNNVARVKVTAASCLIKGCYFECGSAFDAAAAVEAGAGANNFTMMSTTIISTAVLNTSKPSYGFLGSAAVSDMLLLGNTISEGTVGFTNQALALNSTVTRLTCEPLAMLLGANGVFGASTGVVMPTSSGGSAAVSYSGGGA